MNLIGQKVEGNWGAMHPISHGLIDRLIGKDMVEIRWEDGYREEIRVDDIGECGFRSPNGSPIGIFFGEVA